MPGDLYAVSTDPARLDLDVVTRLLNETYWAAGRSRETIRASWEKSICFGAYLQADGAQVGFARVVGDGVTFSWVCDVVVDSAHRGRGLGKLLMRSIVQHPAVRGTRSLLLTRDAHGLYEQFGFERHEAMRRPADAASVGRS